jgi:hypothetical protein
MVSRGAGKAGDYSCSHKTGGIDVERPAHTPARQRFDRLAPVGQESLQRTPVGALHEHLAALQPGAARESGGHRRINLDLELPVANHGGRGIARTAEKRIDLSTLCCICAE